MTDVIFFSCFHPSVVASIFLQAHRIQQRCLINTRMLAPCKLDPTVVAGMTGTGRGSRVQMRLAPAWGEVEGDTGGILSPSSGSTPVGSSKWGNEEDGDAGSSSPWGCLGGMGFPTLEGDEDDAGTVQVSALDATSGVTAATSGD